MGTRRAGASWGRVLPPLLLLLLGPLLLPATAQVLSYQEAVHRAVANFNQYSSDTRLFRLFSPDSGSPEDNDLNIPKPVSFTIKETVCPKTTQLPLEQCDFKKDGVVRHCIGTVTLGPGSSAVSVSCNEVQRSRRMVGLRKAFRKIGHAVGKTAKKIGDFLRRYPPRPHY